MSERTFETQADATGFLRGHFADAGALTADRIATLIEVWALVEKKAVPLPPDAAPALSKRFRWVVQDDDLQLADTLLDCVKTAVTSGGSVLLGSLDATAWTAIAGISTTVFKLVRRAVNKGKVLDPRTFALLLALHEAGPLALDALASRLASNDTKWTHDEVRVRLKDLSAMAMNDGTTRGLVVEDAQGRWRAVGI